MKSFINNMLSSLKNKKNVLLLKKLCGILLIRSLKAKFQISWIVTCVYACLQLNHRFCHPHLVYITLINRSCKWPINGLVDSLQGYCCQTQMLVVGVVRWIKFINMVRFISAWNFIKHSLKVQATITGSRLFKISKEAKFNHYYASNVLKFSFSEKATKICAIFLMVLTFT